MKDADLRQYNERRIRRYLEKQFGLDSNQLDEYQAEIKYLVIDLLDVDHGDESDEADKENAGRNKLSLSTTSIHGQKRKRVDFQNERTRVTAPTEDSKFVKKRKILHNTDIDHLKSNSVEKKPRKIARRDIAIHNKIEKYKSIIRGCGFRVVGMNHLEKREQLKKLRQLMRENGIRKNMTERDMAKFRAKLERTKNVFRGRGRTNTVV